MYNLLLQQGWAAIQIFCQGCINQHDALEVLAVGGCCNALHKFAHEREQNLHAISLPCSSP